MRLHRFYLPQNEENQNFTPKIGADLEISSDHLIHQWRDIFRFKVGDRVLLFNQSAGEWLAEFIALDKKQGAVLRVIEQDRVTEVAIPNKNIALYMAIIKNSNFDLVVEKATELGVSKIVPILTERTVKSGLNFERLNKLAIEAAEQSGRISVPVIEEIQDLENAIQDAKNSYYTVYFGHISDELHTQIADGTAANAKNSKVALFIGPEGGWSDDEIALFADKQIAPISLGQFVLRAETAAIVGLSQLAR